MSVVNVMNGMQGRTETNILGSMPQAGFIDTRVGNRTPREYRSEPIAPKLFPDSIDYSTRRGVLPCVGITHQVLRRPPVHAAGGKIAPTGYGRHQPPGLSQEKPTNLPIMPFSNPFASGYNNPLKAPN